ncbi:hypothetical protein [Sphingomonas sp. Leaf10]|nr:hypothetical protein [Sphingomonas sp. Leaf10]
MQTDAEVAAIVVLLGLIPIGIPATVIVLGLRRLRVAQHLKQENAK